MGKEEKKNHSNVVIVSVIVITCIFMIVLIFAPFLDLFTCSCGTGSSDRWEPPVNNEKVYTFDIRIDIETPNRVQIQFEGFETPFSWNGTYLIDYGDRNNSGWVTINSLTHDYDDLKEYTLRLYAPQDGRSNRFVAKRMVDLSEVGRLRPVAIIKDTNPMYYMSEQPVMLSGDGSYDVDGDVIGYYWDFGDGSHSDLSTGIRDGYQPTKVASHMYDSPGDYIVKLWVMDNDYNISVEHDKIKVRILSHSCY